MQPRKWPGRRPEKERQTAKPSAWRGGIRSASAACSNRQCGKGGDVITLQQHIDNSSFADAVRALTVGNGSSNARRTPAQDLRTTGAHAEADDGYARQQARKAARLWANRRPLEGSIAERYLREARGYGGRLPPTLGFLPAREDWHPAMVAAFAMAPEIEPTILGEPSDVGSVHLTLLKADGSGKADVNPNKIIVGSPASRPIVMAPINDLLDLTISEGIEDALSASWALGMGAWAAGAAGFMPALADVVPGYVERVTIFAHADPRRGARCSRSRRSPSGARRRSVCRRHLTDGH
jgi:hypothetical protein